MSLESLVNVDEIAVMNEIVTEGWVDPHMHFRNPLSDDDGRMEMVVETSIFENEVMVGIGNTKPTVTDLPSAEAHKRQIWELWRSDDHPLILIAPLMHDKTTPAQVHETRRRMGTTIGGWKTFFAHVSNDGGMSVSDVGRMHNQYRSTYAGPSSLPRLPNHVHAERKYYHGHEGDSDYRIPMSEREWYCIDTDVRQLLKEHPGAVWIIKHVTDIRTLEFIREMRRQGYEIYGEIGAHYLVRCHEDLYEGPGGKGTIFNAHDLCWPIYKSRESQLALIEAATNPGDTFFYGSDYACHIDDTSKTGGVKITDDGLVCGGVTIPPAVGKSVILDIFTKAKKVENLNAFVSRNARTALGVGPSERTVRFVRKEWHVPRFLEGPAGQARMFMRGKTCNWQRVVE